MPQVRGSYGFEIDQSGALVDNDANLERTRRLFRDGQIIGNDWGPGNRGDFDHGSWHILCHLAGGSGALQTREGRAWCGITHVGATDTYEATVTWRRAAAVQTRSLKSDEATAATRNAKCLGFIEGSSLGRIAAHGVNDPDTAFNGWPRQMFDQEPSSRRNGGTVWEQWSTTRDIRPSSTIGTSVLRAWLTLVSRLGGRFVAAVARGRREHSHPRQLVALVRAGVLSAAEALWDVDPDPVPKPVQDLLHEATPVSCLAATEKLAFAPDRQRYFMFKRRISRWSSSAQVKQDLETA
jgi:hypothetical protein